MPVASRKCPHTARQAIDPAVKSPRLGHETRTVPLVDEDLAQKAAAGAERRPAPATDAPLLVLALPRELGAGLAVATDVAHVQPAFHGHEGDLAVVLTVERDVGGLSDVQKLVRPRVHPDDPPAALERIG